MEQTQVNEASGVQELLECLKESELLSTPEIDRAVSAAGASAGVLGLCDWLVTAGVLTAYQMEAVSNRTYSQLRIGNYDVLDRLGAGGMGTVFKARHRRMKRIVALKVLSSKLAKDESFVHRFQREVETIARLSHPNVVMAFDADEDEAGHFLVMEFVDGKDFSSLVQVQGPFDVAAAVSCIAQAARGLAYAHGQGIIHRDIKPANLLMDAQGVVKVTDLGLARFNTVGAAPGAAAPSGITQAGGVVGTVDYMPPEQAIDSTSIDQRADIYSLGATLYYLLVGKPPFQGQTMMATLLKHREAPIPSLADSGKEIPAALDAIFRRMMAKAPADRYQTMTEVVQALEAFETSLGRMASPWPGGPIPSPDFDLENQLSAATGTGDRTVAMEPRLPATHVARLPQRVLLVEPSRTQSTIIRKYLQADGVPQVVAAATGREAIAAIKKECPDAIICSMYLADMTGIQLAQQVRAEHQHDAPGFVLISSEGQADEGTLSKCGRAILLHKPFTTEKLMEALRVVSNACAAVVAWSQTMPQLRSLPLRVLLVDDSAPARLHERNVLQEMGVTHVVEASDGAQAVAILARETFDLIVTDYNMPLMDGGKLVAYMKQDPATASVPIILVTTEQDPAKLDAVRRLGVAAVCDKSFPLDAVRRIVAQLVKPT